jgi:hypothetical protein
MASGITHKTVGTQITQGEFEAADAHTVANLVNTGTLVSKGGDIDLEDGGVLGSTANAIFTTAATMYVQYAYGGLFIRNKDGSAYLSVTDTGAVRAHAYGAGTTSFDANGNFVSSSDERLKDIQGEYIPGLAAILQINPIRFKWKNETGLDTDNAYVGFSAQNVMKYLPGAVGKGPDGYYTLSDRTIIAALVNAVKELKAEIATLRATTSLPDKPYPITPDDTEKDVIKSKPPLPHVNPVMPPVEDIGPG